MRKTTLEPTFRYTFTKQESILTTPCGLIGKLQMLKRKMLKKVSLGDYVRNPKGGLIRIYLDAIHKTFNMESIPYLNNYTYPLVIEYVITHEYLHHALCQALPNTALDKHHYIIDKLTPR